MSDIEGSVSACHGEAVTAEVRPEAHAVEMRRPGFTRVVVSHVQPLIELGVAAALRPHPDLDVVTMGGPSSLFCKGLSLQGADVAVVDYEQGLDLLAAFRKAPSTTHVRVLILSSLSRECEVIAAIERGADGYQLEDCTGEELVRVVRTLAQGGRHLCSAAVQRMAGRLSCVPLTIREREVLSLLASGRTNKTIAQDLMVSLDTVKVHVRHILRKLGVSSRTEASTLAIRRGLIDEAPVVVRPLGNGAAQPDGRRSQPWCGLNPVSLTTHPVGLASRST